MNNVVVRSARPAPVLELLSTPDMVRGLWRYRDLVRQFTAREVVVRHKGTTLGVVWAVAQPILTLLTYTLVFGFFFRSRWEAMAGPDWANFTLNFFAGYIVFSLFSETVNRAPSLITEHPNLVRKVIFPLEILPITSLGAGVFYGAVSTIILLVAAAAVTGTLHWTIVLFPLVLVPLVMLTLGLAWLLASLGVFIRDMRQVVPVMTQLLFFLTPVFYPLERVPEQFRPIILANPLTELVQDARRTLLWGEQPDWLMLGVVTAGSAAAMQLGYAWFLKSKRGMADVI